MTTVTVQAQGEEEAQVNADEIRHLLRLGILDRNSAADRDLARSLLDSPKEIPVTWNGIPEHRNLGGDGEQPERPPSVLRDFLDRARQQQPRQSPSMPADPFNGLAAGAVASVEIIRAHVEAGLTEQQAIFYCACLTNVALAMQQGGLIPPPDQP